jgi:AraC-like DNA-binding protein
MEHITDWYFILVFFAGVLGCIVALILFSVNKTEPFTSRLLAAFLVCISLLAINYGLMTTRFFIHHPHLWRVLGFVSFSFAPFGYLYVRNTLHQTYRLRLSDGLFFLPALIHPLMLVPFFLLPTEEKVSFLHKVLQNPGMITAEPESLLPEGVSAIARVLVGVIATVGQFVLLANWRHRHSQLLTEDKQNSETYKWLYNFTTTLAVFWFLIICEFLLQFTLGPIYDKTLVFTISGAIFFVSMYLLLQPSILYGIKGWAKMEVFVTNAQHFEKTLAMVAIPEPKKFSLTSEQGETYKKKLEDHFQECQPFRKRGYTIGDLSKEIDIPPYLLSAFINQEYSKNFNELINEYRVNFLISQVKKEESAQYTLEALGKEAGFNSRAAFIAAVKKTTGKNPSSVFGRREEKIKCADYETVQ